MDHSYVRGVGGGGCSTRRGSGVVVFVKGIDHVSCLLDQVSSTWR